MTPLLAVLTAVAELGCALVSGVFFAFSTLVMKALSRLPAPQGIAAMQAINRAALTPVFLALFLGTGAACAAVAVWSLFLWENGFAVWLLVGGLIYLIGSFGLTAGYHVPRNNALDAVDPASAGAVALWTGYLPGWTRWNHVRGCAALVAAILFVVTLVIG